MSTITDQHQVVAWYVEIRNMNCIVFTTTKAKAQWIATRDYWDTYGNAGWPRAVAFRAKTYDKSALRFEIPKAFSESHVMDYPNKA